MGYLDKLDLDKKLESKEEYEELLEEYQFKLLKLQRKVIEKGIAVALAYEGCDAAGKGETSSASPNPSIPADTRCTRLARRAREKRHALAAAVLAAAAPTRAHRHL